MTIRKALLAPVAACLAAIWQCTAAADGVHVKIDGQRLDSGLYALWQLTGLEYKLPAGEAWLAARTKAIDDTFTSPEVALRDMLECSGYGYKWLDYPRKVSIIPAEDAPAGKGCLFVIGRNLLEPDFREREGDALPYIVLDRKQIEHRQALSVTGLAQDIIVGGGGWSTGPVPGSMSPNPVAIAARRTLIDGYEVPAFYSGGASVPAIAALPLRAIERVEVFPETYSRVGGGSSGSKSINFVISRECERPVLNVDLGSSFASGAGLRRVYAGTCQTVGETQLQLKAAMSEQQALRVGDRDYLRDARAAMLVNDPASVYRRNTPWLSDQVSVKFLDTEGPASIALLSREDIETRNVAAAIANSGTVRTALANSAQADGGSGASLLDRQESYYLDVYLRRRISDSIWARLDLVASQAITRAATSVGDSIGLQGVHVPANALGNFFHRDLIASIPLEGLDFDLERALTTRRFAASLDYRPNADIRASVDVFGGRSTFSWSQPTAPGMAEAIASGEVDVFNINSDSVRQWVQDYYTPPQVSRWWQVTAEVSRQVSLTSRSTLSFTGQLERVSNRFEGGLELMRGRSDPEPNKVAMLAGQTQMMDGAMIQASYILDSASNQTHVLELRLAGTADRYLKRTNNQRCVPTCPADAVAARTVYRSINPSIGVTYQATREWAVSGSFSEGARVPASEEIGGSATTIVSAATFRGLQSVAPDELILVQAGGNPNVEPEQLRSWSVGLEYKPSLVSGLTVQVDYINVTKKHEIAIPTEVAYSDFPLFVSTYGGGIQSLTADNPFGASLWLDLTARNIAEAESRALEGTIRYQWQSAHGFEITLFTQLHSQLLLRRRASPTSPWDDKTGVTAYSPSRFAWTNELSFARGPFSIGWISRYLGDYRPSTRMEEIQSQGASDVPSQFYQDMHMSYRFGALGRARIETELQAGITNLFNTSPRRDVTQRYAISPQDDPRLRSFLLSATVRF
jgi:outer membrane receptor protein involved in Fe transport